jgi:hypothetical protein
MTNLRKSFILLSAAITMGNLEQAQAAGQKNTPPSQTKQNAAGARQVVTQERVSKRPKASRRNAEPDFNLGMPAGFAYDVVSRRELA